jgi:two-component system, NtrC family, response regulator GlrR
MDWRGKNPMKIPKSSLEENSPSTHLQKALGLGQIIGQSPAFVAVLRQIPNIAKYDVCILILGETGTGKELFARAVHYHSRRSGSPFVPVNCGALPAELVENEFFGHAQGAFTGANAFQRGLLHEANGGTLFLDEVDSLPLQAQVKLLRFMQDGQFRPLGSEKLITSDVRLIAASNVDLLQAMRSGKFREDLYYRLNVVSLRLPALRDREDDILLLAAYFLERCRDKLGGEAKQLSPAAMERLVCYNWPGNVRELENAVQRAFVLAAHTVIEPEDLCTGLHEVRPDDLTFQTLKARMVNEFEQAYIRRVLRVHSGNITKAAESAGKDRRAFWELMRKHHIRASIAAPPEDLPRQTDGQAGQFFHSRKFLDLPPEIKC